MNGIEVNRYNQSNPEDSEATTNIVKMTSIKGGETKIIHIYVDGPGGKCGWQTLTAGTALQISVISTSGLNYPIHLITV